MANRVKNLALGRGRYGRTRTGRRRLARYARMRPAAFMTQPTSTEPESDDVAYELRESSATYVFRLLGRRVRRISEE